MDKLRTHFQLQNHLVISFEYYTGVNFVAEI
jgi:hypothetical protein